MNAEIPAEIEFLTATVQPEPDLDRIKALVAQNLDWEKIAQVAVKRHKVGPLLYRNLIESGFENTVPNPFVERLRQYSRRTAARNLSLTTSLLSILRYLREEGIPALPYKGPVLSEAVYADFSLRQSRDLDVLVRPDDLFDAEAILLEQGFEQDRELTENEKRLLVENHRHRTVKNDGVIVELHPRISSPDPPFEVETLVDRAGSVHIAGDSLPAIEPLDLLLILSVHGTRHRWNQLKWICDIAYLIQSEDFDWAVVLKEAKRRNCQRRVLLGCGLASTILDVDVSDQIYSEVRNKGQSLFQDTHPDCLLGVDDVTSLRYRLRSRDNTADRLHYLWNKLTVPPVHAKGARPTPGGLFGLEHFVQPLFAIGTKSLLLIQTLASKLRSLMRERI